MTRLGNSSISRLLGSPPSPNALIPADARAPRHPLAEAVSSMLDDGSATLPVAAFPPMMPAPHVMIVGTDADAPGPICTDCDHALDDPAPIESRRAKPSATARDLMTFPPHHRKPRWLGSRRGRYTSSGRHEKRMNAPPAMNVSNHASASSGMAEDWYAGVPAICGTESKPLQCFCGRSPCRNSGLGSWNLSARNLLTREGRRHKPGAHGESLSFTQSYGKQALVLRSRLVANSIRLCMGRIRSSAPRRSVAGGAISSRSETFGTFANRARSGENRGGFSTLERLTALG